jgi:hypothetical protein
VESAGRKMAGRRRREAVESCRQDKDAWVDALLDEIKHVAYDALSEEQDKVEVAPCL